jgi:hypothetical protein
MKIVPGEIPSSADKWAVKHLPGHFTIIRLTDSHKAAGIHG